MRRFQIFFLGALSSYATSGLNIIFGIVTVPIGLKYFGVGRYSAFIIISTLLTYLSATNLGIPVATRILGVKCLDEIERLRLIAKSFLLIIIISAISLLLFLFATRFEHWGYVIGKIPADIYKEVETATFYSGIFFLVNLPIGLFADTFISIQKIHIERIYNTLSTNMTYIAMLAAVWVKGDLISFAIIRGVLVMVISLICCVHFLYLTEENRHVLKKGVVRTLLEPSRIEEFNVRSILITGLRNFVMGFAGLIVWNSDNLLISHFLGFDNVSAYSITWRLVIITFMGFSGINYALAPLMGRAFAMKDYDWVNRTYDRVVSVSQIIGGLIWIGSLAFAEDIVRIWVGPAGYSGHLSVFGMGGYGFLLSISGVSSILLLGTNLIKNGIAISWSLAGAKLVFSLILLQRFGVAGLALGTFLAELFTNFWLTPREIYVRTEGKLRFNYHIVIRHFLTAVLPALTGVIIVNFVVPFPGARFLLKVLIVLAYCLFSLLRAKPEISQLLESFRENLAKAG